MLQIFAASGHFHWSSGTFLRHQVCFFHVFVRICGFLREVPSVFVSVAMHQYHFNSHKAIYSLRAVVTHTIANTCAVPLWEVCFVRLDVFSYYCFYKKKAPLWRTCGPDLANGSGRSHVASFHPYGIWARCGMWAKSVPKQVCYVRTQWCKEQVCVCVFASVYQTRDHSQSRERERERERERARERERETARTRAGQECAGHRHTGAGSGSCKDGDPTGQV